ncbi:TPR domain protein [Nemania sp. FL0031]|nr:TPR domain protein [Nemania sp. FL0031]
MDSPEFDQTGFMLRQCLDIAEQANRRRGHVPKDHPLPHAVVNQFMRQRASNVRKIGQDNFMLQTSQLPHAYPPSVRLIDDLVSMPISQMELQKSHRGKKAVVRVITPQDTINAIMAIIEDEEGTAVLLQLYHQQSLTATNLEDKLRPNMVLIIKEPFFKAAGDGAYSIRVDHISDVVWLQDNDPRIPSKWKHQGSKTEPSAAVRVQGNMAVKNKQWAKAENLYSHAVRVAQTPEEGELAYLNRSLVNLQLQRPEKALEDALTATKGGRLDEKGLFREARALYELGKFTESVKKWHKLTQSYPQNMDARKELKRCEERVKEAETGEYNFAAMYKQAKATPPLIDCATYKGPVSVREVPGRGNGLFTTKPVKAGDLLLCEKAFAYCYADKDDPVGLRNMRILVQLDTKRVKLGGQAHLLTDIIQKLYHSPQAAEDFKALHHGDYPATTVTETDGKPVVDTFLVNRIINCNSFGAPRTSHGRYTFDGKIVRDIDHTTCGIWVLASRINHSCLGNCRRSFIGDMHIVRACEDLPAGTELRFPYQIPDPKATYDETQKLMSNWGFVCDCPWCLDCKSTTKKTLQKRNSLLDDLKTALKQIKDAPSEYPMLLTKISRLLKEAKATYPKREGAIHIDLMDGYFCLSHMLLSLNRLRDGAESIIKGLEVLGYDIVACPPRSGEKGLEIRRWGHVDNASVVALIRLQEAYEVIAPELCVKAGHYARILYGICTGTDTTIGDVFPQLK